MTALLGLFIGIILAFWYSTRQVRKDSDKFETNRKEKESEKEPWKPSHYVWCELYNTPADHQSIPGVFGLKRAMRYDDYKKSAGIKDDEPSLEDQLNNAVESEDYERAAKIRDIINNQKQKS